MSSRILLPRQVKVKIPSRHILAENVGDDTLKHTVANLEESENFSLPKQ